jgi:hypothetical protein
MENPYSVQLWPNGKWDGKPYQKVYAGSPQEAAEKRYGSPLHEQGNLAQIRAQVRFGLRSTGIAFYER